MKKPAAAAIAFVLGLAMPAQGGPPTFVPKEGAIVQIVAEDIPSLLGKLPHTAVGRLLAEPEVASAFAACVAHFRERAARTDLLIDAAAAMGIDTITNMEPRVMRRFDPADLVRFEATALPPAEGTLQPTSLFLFACRPQAEGRLTRLFEADAAVVAKSPHYTAVAEAKIGGFPARVFRFAADQGDQHGGLAPLGAWFLHLPGVFTYGLGTPEDGGAVGPAPARPAARVALTLDLQAYVAMFARFGGGMPTEFSALGLDGLKLLQWRGTFAGERILDELELTFADKPTGLLGAMLTGTAKLPAQPLPEGALVQLRCAVDQRLLLDALLKMAGTDSVAESMQQDLRKAFDGGLAIGAAAPAAGGLIPRIYLSLGIADRDALQRALAMAFPGDAAKKQVSYEGIDCTVLTLPGLPAAVQPTFCQVAGVLHVAESALSMRAFLKQQKQGGEAMDVGDAPLPEGPGDAVPFDLRCDEAALYRAFHDVWLPLYAMLPDAAATPSLLQRDDMPAPEAVAKHTGKSRGGLRKREQCFTIQHLGALGGPEAAALAMTWGPILSGSFHHTWQDDQLTHEIGKRKLEAVWPALEAYQKAKGSWPETLGELFAAGKLAADALTMPGDSQAEDVALPAGDSRTIKSSFRYFPTPVKVADAGNVLLLAIRPQSYNRVMLTDDGRVPDYWGEQGLLAIDKFK